MRVILLLVQQLSRFTPTCNASSLVVPFQQVRMLAKEVRYPFKARRSGHTNHRLLDDFPTIT